jgi:hypothetical protein
MVNEVTRCGLIVAQSARTTALLDELIALCDWPVVRRPSARTLFQQIDISRPLCLAFWLEAASDISPTAQLVSRLRDRGPRPYRIAIAHRLGGSVEHTFRSAGVHTYLATAGNLAALVDEALFPFVDEHRVAAHSQPAHAPEVPVAIRGPTEVRGLPASMRPP